MTPGLVRSARPNANVIATPPRGRAGFVRGCAVLVVILLLGLAAGAADARPSTPAMSCAAVQALVARSRGILLDTSPTTFDRYVASRRDCMPGEGLKPAFERARDTSQCFVGYTCYQPSRDRWDQW